MTARLFPDYAATPTATERKQARTDNARQQLDMFDTDTDPTPPHGIPRPCPVCAGDHADADCTHGTAPTLDCQQCGRTTYWCQCRNNPTTNNPSNPAQVRAMFAALGWNVTK